MSEEPGGQDEIKAGPAPDAASQRPMLLRLRSGKTAALVISAGFGGGLTLLGVGSAALSPLPGFSIFTALKGYLLATSPLYVLAALVAMCRSELWLDPAARAFRLLTYRPWLFRPRVEEASVSEYSGVRTEPADEADGGGVLVSLVTAEGEAVPVRQFHDRGEAAALAEKIAAGSGLWLRLGDTAAEPAGSGAS